MICHYRLYCTLQSFFWAWALLSTPHRPIVRSFKGSEAAALSLSVVRTTTAHYLLRNTIFVSSTLIITRRRSNTELPQSRHDSNGSLLKCFPRHRLYKREIVCSFKEKEKKWGIPTKTAPLLLLISPFSCPNSRQGCLLMQKCDFQKQVSITADSNLNLGFWCQLSLRIFYFQIQEKLLFWPLCSVLWFTQGLSPAERSPCIDKNIFISVSPWVKLKMLNKSAAGRVKY